MEPPSEPMSVRKKPELEQDDVLEPTRRGKGWKIGDRKKPPVFDFSLRYALFEEAEAMVSSGIESVWVTGDCWF